MGQQRERENKNVKATEFHLHFFLEFDSVNMEYDIFMEFESYNIWDKGQLLRLKFFHPKEKKKKKTH